MSTDNAASPSNNNNTDTTTNDVNKETWRTPCINVPARFRSPDGTVQDRTINLMDFMGPDSKYGKVLNTSTCLQPLGMDCIILFPSITDATPESIKHVRSHLVQECAATFRLRAGGLEKDRMRIVFRCIRNHMYKARPVNGKPIRPSMNRTRPMTPEERCHFCFTVSFRNGNWIFSTGTGKGHHCNHPPAPVNPVAEPEVVVVEAPAAAAKRPYITIDDDTRFDHIYEEALKASWARQQKRNARVKFSHMLNKIIELSDQSFPVYSLAHKTIDKLESECIKLAREDPVWKRKHQPKPKEPVQKVPKEKKKPSWLSIHSTLNAPNGQTREITLNSQLAMQIQNAQGTPNIFNQTGAAPNNQL
ncbi:hypothetical protein FisN_6Hu040 [Fistulifera solaris]|jgi:hypothetical protein|uniref:Uncharacterized protein n=1 Tax=Fistulifera solaris TaxID=1519565 RepID=A0A1Z5KIK4_FISSO|nr:hypothetical protein FisN_6Hu040 [Fistulifera solaris]|eukprot:GAX25922.1 hypothetical protein FisN_6Hu040 [Fistulifera solaris]